MAASLLTACGGGGTTASTATGVTTLSSAQLASVATAHASLATLPEWLEFRVVNTAWVKCAALPQEVTVTYGTPKNGSFVVFDDAKDGKELCYLAFKNEAETVSITVKNADGTDFPGSGLVELDVEDTFNTTSEPPVNPPPPPPANVAPTASAVTFSGTPIAGQTLTGSYTYADADNDVEGSSTYRWLRNGVAISGATASTYVLLTGADVGTTLTFAVTPVAAAGTTTGTEVLSTASDAVAAAPGQLNDTGITQCGNASANGLACPQAGFPVQDAETGRDATQATNNDADGHRGFSFTKLDADGVALADQTVAYATTPWACVKDNVTGLIWEVKTDDGGLHDKDWTYSWYEPDNSKNGGNAGTPNGGVCGSTSTCDTASYVTAVNAVAGGWCGATGWRMPTVDELSGIARLDRYQFPATDQPTIDTAYFPNTTSTSAQYGAYAVFWSSSPVAANGNFAWSVNFGYGYSLWDFKEDAFQVRLVRSGQ